MIIRREAKVLYSDTVIAVEAYKMADTMMRVRKIASDALPVRKGKP
jgi:hypothetical protein